MMKLLKRIGLTVVCMLAAQVAQAGIHIRLDATHPHDKYHRTIGSIYAVDTVYGVLFIPHLRGLKPGMHGFHIHEHPKCTNFAMDAGGHYDPDEYKRHRGPFQEDGHMGDLPNLFADKDGTVTLPVFAPRLSLWHLKHRALIIHAHLDNYRDKPAKNGGSGDRVACGVIR